jgi:hypothetical protein
MHRQGFVQGSQQGGSDFFLADHHHRIEVMTQALEETSLLAGQFCHRRIPFFA